MFVDTHCHLTLMQAIAGKTVDEVVADAAAVGVDRIITIATTLQDAEACAAITKEFDSLWMTAGIHPCDCSESWKKDFSTIKKLVQKRESKIVALGETGLDFYHKPFFKQRQIDSFIAHIECAMEHDLPVIVHLRDSAEAVLKVLERYKGEVRGVVHCFSQKKDIADILLEFGFYLGFGGTISYPKNEWLRELIQTIDLRRILLETDAPFLPPQPFRGKRNFPKYIPLIAQIIADLRGIAVDEVGAVTSQNAEDLFSI